MTETPLDKLKLDELETFRALAHENPLAAHTLFQAFDPVDGGEKVTSGAVRLALDIACEYASPPESWVAHDFVRLAAQLAQRWNCPEAFYEPRAMVMGTFRQAGNPHAVRAFLEEAATLPAAAAVRRELVRDSLSRVKGKANKNNVEALQLAATLARIPVDDPDLTKKLLQTTFELLGTLAATDERGPETDRKIDDLVSNIAREARATNPAYGPAFVRMGFDFVHGIAQRNPPLAEELMTRLQLEACYTGEPEITYAAQHGLTVAAACAGDPDVPSTTVEHFVREVITGAPFVPQAFIRTLFGILAAPDQPAARASDAFTHTALMTDRTRVINHLPDVPDDALAALPLLGKDNPEMARQLGIMLCRAADSGRDGATPPRLYQELVLAPSDLTEQWSMLIPQAVGGEPLALINGHAGPLSDVTRRLAREAPHQNTKTAQYYATVANDFAKLASRISQLPRLRQALRPPVAVVA